MPFLPELLLLEARLMFTSVRFRAVLCGTLQYTVASTRRASQCILWKPPCYDSGLCQAESISKNHFGPDYYAGEALLCFCRACNR